MPDDPAVTPPLSPDLAGELEALADQLAARHDHADIAARFEWLIDVLILRGQLPATFRRLVDKVRGRRSVVKLAIAHDKYAVVGNDIDCAALMPLCGGRCCTYSVSLSQQDLEEKLLPYDFNEPYVLPRDPDTERCACLADDNRCTVYDHRPLTCRKYDCRNDERVWIDFAARIPVPLPARR